MDAGVKRPRVPMVDVWLVGAALILAVGAVWFVLSLGFDDGGGTSSRGTIDAAGGVESTVPRALMTAEDFGRIRTGMPYADVALIAGSDGTVLSESNVAGIHTVIYMWHGSGTAGANANVTFQGGVVIGKAQFGLR